MLLLMTEEYQGKFVNTLFIIKYSIFVVFHEQVKVPLDLDSLSDSSELEFGQSLQADMIALKNPNSIFKKPKNQFLTVDKQQNVAFKLTDSHYQIGDDQLKQYGNEAFELNQSLEFSGNIEYQKLKGINESVHIHQDQDIEFTSTISKSKINNFNPILASKKQLITNNYQLSLHRQKSEKPIFTSTNTNSSSNTLSNEQTDLYFEEYETKFESARLMVYLSKQTSTLFTKEQQKQKAIFEYILKLKSLLLVFTAERNRMNAGIDSEEKQNLISQCKTLVITIYNDLKINRKVLNSEYEGIYKQMVYKRFVKKVVENPTKIYTIFELQQLESCYAFIISQSYTKINQIFEQKHTQIHLRIGLLLLICLKIDDIFKKSKLQENFRQFYEYRKIVRRDRLQINQLYQYILEGKSRVILKHYKDLRSIFGLCN